MRRIVAIVFAVVMLVALARPAEASMIGVTSNCAITPTPLWTCNVPSAVVGAGIEFQLLLSGSPFFSVDLGASSVTLTLISTGGLVMGAGEQFDLSNLFPPSEVIAGFGLSVVGATGFTASDISFTPHALSIVLNGQSWSPGNQAIITLESRAVAPEPATWALLSLGIAAACARRRLTARS